MKHLEVAVHCRCHQRREPVFISKIDERASIGEPLRCLPIPLRRRDYQRCPPLRIAPVWIDMFDQAEVNKRRTFNRHRSNQISGRNRDARTGFGRNRRRPQQYQKDEAALEDSSPFGYTHWQRPVGNYTWPVEQLNRNRSELRARLRTSWDWTRPVEHCMFTAVQVPTNAFIHFDYMRGNEYIVCGATRGRSDAYGSRRGSGSGQRRRSSIEQCIREGLRNRGTKRGHY